MKKVFFAVVVGLVICAAGFTGYSSYGIYLNQIGLNKDNLLTYNIESLSQDEGYPIVIPPVVISCDGGNSGRCHDLLLEEGMFGACRYYCDFTGDTDDYCSCVWREILNFCSIMAACNG